MKRNFALLLILMLLCFAGLTSAQEATIGKLDAPFTVSFILPGGARVSTITSNDSYSKSTIRFLTGDRPTVDIIMAADDLYYGQSFSDLSGDDINLIITQVTSEMTSPVADVQSTPDGHEFIVANESTANNDTSDAVMLYDGYFIMVHVYYEDFHELTQEDMEIATAIAASFQFSPSEKEY